MKNCFILIGPPGSGKGTIGSLLENEFGVRRYVMSDILKEEIQSNQELKDIIKKGELINDDLVEKIFTEHFFNEDKILLDGIPRDLEQGEFILNFLKLRNYQIKVIDLVIEEEELKSRIINRYFCPKCHRVYNILTLPPKNKGICDDDGENLVQREDDTKEIFEHRYEIYKQETMPVIDYFKNQVEKVIYIQSSKSINEIKNDLEQEFLENKNLS